MRLCVHITYLHRFGGAPVHGYVHARVRLQFICQAINIWSYFITSDYFVEYYSYIIIVKFYFLILLRSDRFKFVWPEKIFYINPLLFLLSQYIYLLPLFHECNMNIKRIKEITYF